jgi:hypothetical protein
MAPREWNAYVGLNITSRDSRKMTCVGNTRFGKRCRIDIEGASFRKVRAILDAMESQPPNKAMKQLEKLAQLSLCSEWHQDQEDDMVEQWERAIIVTGKEYERGMGLRRKIHSLQEKLDEEEAKTEELQKKLEKLQLPVGKTVELGEQELKVQSLETQSRLDEALRSLTSANVKLRDAQHGYQDQKVQTEKYRHALLLLTRDHQKLEEEKIEMSDQLDAEREALKLAKRQCDENSVTSSQLTHDLTIKSVEYQRSISQTSQIVKRITTERDSLLAILTALRSQICGLNAKLAQMDQKRETTTTERTALSKEVEDLKRRLDLELKANSNYQSDQLRTQDNCDAISNELDGVRSRLDTELQKSTELVLNLVQAETRHTTLLNEKTILQSLLETQLQKNEELSAELNQLKTEHGTLFIEMQSLRIGFASKQETSSRLVQELSIAKEDVSTTNLVLGETQAALEDHQRSIAELKTASAEREKENSALIAALIDQIDFVKSHLFREIFMGLMDRLKRWMNGVILWIGSAGYNRRIIAGTDSEVDFSV